MAGAPRQFNDPVIVPIKLEKELKNKLTDHCRKNGIMLSAVIRKMIVDYAKKEGLI